MARKRREKADQVVPKMQSGQGPAGDPGEGSGEIIDMKEAIKLLDTTRSTFYRWLRGGKVKGMKVGRQWRFYREDVERFLKGQEPRIDLPADIGPLIQTLLERAQQLEAEDISLPETLEPNSVEEAVNLMILLAGEMNASDIHLAPQMTKAGEEAVGVLRYRVDGVLHQIAEIDPRLLPAIIERWKSMAACNIHEKGKPQDGRILLKPRDTDREMDMRVTFLPTALGESLTVRIIASAAWFAHLNLDHIDFAPHDKERILRWVKAPWGMIVVSGPTGSGKTTVLYACLNHVARPEVKVMTAEDPVEVLLPWAVQMPVQPNAGVTFPVAVRSILRSDPDVIMIGEIRDSETLDLAHACALTGHLVMTVMHAAHATSALKRMAEIGSDPYIIGESVKLVVAQRLVRKLCPDCSVEKSPPAELLERVADIARKGGLDWDSLPKNFREPVGCSNCKETGYRGRTVIAETLEVTPEIISAFRRGASDAEMQAIAVGQGMTTIAADGVRRAAMGETSLAEAMRVTGGLA